MKLVLRNGEIALPKDFSFQMQHSHPFYSSAGSRSVPATLPASKENLSLIGDVTDINRSNRFLRQHAALLYCGSYFRSCRMVVDSGHSLDGIDMSLALDESEAYAEIQDKRLKDLLADEKFSIARADPWYLYHSSDTPSVRRRCLVFPVAVDVDGEGSQASVGVINCPNSGKTDFVHAARQISHGSGTVSVPEGYGLTCFPRLPELISLVFQKCGYTVTNTSNVFLSDPKLKQLVLLNGCADALLSSYVSYTDWKVRYADIIPDITVGDLISWLRDKFGAFVTVSGKKIFIRLLRDIIASAPDMDFTPFLDGSTRPTVSYPEQKTLEIALDTGLEGAAPAAESLEDLRSSYQTLNVVNGLSDITGTGLFFVKLLGKYYYRNSGWATPSLLGSNAFLYRRTTDVKSKEELKTDDVFAPMIYHTSLGMYMPYVGDSVRRYVDIDDKEKEASQPLMVCNVHWNASLGRWSATPYSYDEAGSAASPAAGELTPEGLYADYWSSYHRQIIDGAPEIRCTFLMPVEKLFSMDFWTPKLFHGMKVLVKSLDYVLSDRKVVAAEAVLQTVPVYDDAVEIPEVPPFGTNTAWVRAYDDDESDLPSGGTLDYDVTATDGLTDYTSADAPDWNPSFVGQRAKERSRYFDWAETDRGYRTGRYGTHYYTEYFKAVFAE